MSLQLQMIQCRLNMIAELPSSILHPAHFTRAAAHLSEVPDVIEIAGADVREPQRLGMWLQELFQWHRLSQVNEEDRVREDRLRHSSRVSGAGLHASKCVSVRVHVT